MPRILESDEFVEIDCEIRVTHGRRGQLDAILINDGKREAWIARALIESPDPEDLSVGQHVTLLLPRWVAEEKGLV